jgi:methylenetetrahydrofolate dehydrogenase (NADP+)/methenyltetrahydrofolate cyclohydrolase
LETDGRKVVVIGKGKLIGCPLATMLHAPPFNGDITAVNQQTKDIKHVTSAADIIIAACGHAYCITEDFISEGATLIDCGINRASETSKKIVGDFCPRALQKSAYHTKVLL